MRISLLTQLKNLSIMVNRGKQIILMLQILVLGTIAVNQSNAQDCNTIMACNDGVQISLEENCTAIINPNMILEGQVYPNSSYTVEARTLAGLLIPNATVNSTHKGMTLQVKVTLNGCANSCWGYATIEDKLPPVIETCPCTGAITSISGNIPGGVTFNRPNDITCSGNTPGVHYALDTFALDKPGIVTLSLGGVSSRFSLYRTSFDPLNPCPVNLIATNVTAFTGALLANTNYIIVVSTLGTAIPAGGVNYNFAISNASGSIISSTMTSICEIECINEASFLNQTAINATNRPVFRDACDNLNLVYAKIDGIQNLTCSDRYAKQITRTWTVTDRSGNRVTKEQVFYLKKGVLEDIVWPPNYDNIDKDAFKCTTNLTLLPNGAPSTIHTGVPSGITCQNFQNYYTDLIFDLCGASKKVLRQWFVIDWCTGRDTIHNQIIKILDDQKPLVTVIPTISGITSCLGNVSSIAFTDPNLCTGTWNVVPPTVAFECSTWTYSVSYIANDGTELPPVNGSYSTANVTGNATTGYKISGLPLGCNWIKYTITDACGNTADAFTEILVQDKQAPTAVCEGNTVVSITNSGWGEVFATSIDDHSTDNCGIDTMLIRRQTSHCAGFPGDLIFRDKVNFCCTDVTNPSSYIKVVLRVFDKAGNFNDCVANVQVQDKSLPTITCPPHITLQCGQEHTNTTVTGVATGTDNCNTTITSQLNGSLNQCGKGNLTRVWRSTDAQGNSVSCTQNITVTDNNPFNLSNFPALADRVLASCDLNDATPDALNSKPVLTNTDCTNLAISHTDQVFYETPEACIKILRTWRVIDWCNYNPISGPIYERVQTIKLTGSTPPIFTTPCTNIIRDDIDGTCDESVTLEALATDPCSNTIQYRWTIDLGNNNSVDLSGNGRTFTRTLPTGTHRVTFFAKNRCQIEGSCTYTITIRDRKKPTPICIREVVWVLDEDGTTEVWASDFNLKSEDSCDEPEDLKYTFDAQGLRTAQTFTCADIPNGQVATIPLRMYVFDKAGNFEFCEVNLILQDSPLKNACPDVAGLLPTVSGKITTHINEEVEAIEVGLTNMTNELSVKDMTNQEGKYTFTGVNVFDPKTIEAFKNDDPMNGVSTLDLVLIQRHILGITPIESPYLLLAADINNSRSITTSDLVQLRKMILGIQTSFDNNTSWRFIPKGYVFADPTFPYDFPNKVNIDSLFADKSDVNFIAIKVGDINTSAIVNLKNSKSESRTRGVNLYAQAADYVAGQNVEIQVKAEENISILGTQFTINFDANLLKYKQIDGGTLKLLGYHVNDSRADEGILTLSYDHAIGLNIEEGNTLFTIKFMALSNTNNSHLKINSEVLNAEIYDLDGESMNLRLNIKKSEAGVFTTSLYQNEPNPFTGQTMITYELSEETNVELKIFDINGRQVFNTTRMLMPKGIHNVNVTQEQLGGKAGMYYYQLEAGKFSNTRKMILIE